MASVWLIVALLEDRHRNGPEGEVMSFKITPGAFNVVDCAGCALKLKCCPTTPARKVPRSIYAIIFLDALISPHQLFCGPVQTLGESGTIVIH
jgi:hypothetical protein